MNALSNPRNQAVARRNAQHGGLLIEVLVSLVLCAFGLLGFVAMQARAAAAEFESLQRSQALVLVEDMVARISANRANAGSYISANLYGSGSVASCSSLSGAALDLCEWGNLLRGATETASGSGVGAMINARGCITRAAATAERYVVTVVWQGQSPTAAPAATCGQGDAAFPDETLRRAVSATVCVALLRDPAVPSATSRC